MLNSEYDAEFKKATATEADRFSDLESDFEDVDGIEYCIGRTENRINIVSRRRSDANPAWTKKENSPDAEDSVTKVLYQHLSHTPSKDQIFGFPEPAGSELGLKCEDARIRVTDTTGAVALTQSPEKRFILQTPLDDGPFCAMSIKHTSAFNCSALYLYSDPIFDLSHILRDQTWMFCWRWNGLPILILPIAFLAIHDTYISSRLAHLHGELAQIESTLLVPDSPQASVDFSQLTRRLHAFSTALSNLARRAHFQDTALSTVTEALCTMNGPAGFTLEIQRARLDGLKKAMLARRYDLDVMPKRELTARATIFNLVVQRDQAISLAIGQANLDIARNARQIAEATLRDSTAMRTIAVLTMLFLPGTAIASFFSMTMFNWTPSADQASVSSYIWIYFVLAVPLTALVLGVWWYWHRVRARTAKRRHCGDREELYLSSRVM